MHLLLRYPPLRLLLRPAPAGHPVQPRGLRYLPGGFCFTLRNLYAS